MSEKNSKAKWFDILKYFWDEITFGALSVDTHIHDMIHKGKIFTSVSLLTLAPNVPQYALIKSGATKELNYSPTRYESNGQDVLIEFFELPVTTNNGTEITTIKNRKLGNTTPREFKIFLNPTVTSDGSRIDIHLIGGGSGPGQSRSGGLSPGGEEWIFPANTNILVKYTNRGSAPCSLAISSLSYEK